MTRSLAAATEAGNRAFLAGDLEQARTCYEEAVALLGPADDPVAPLAYENLGLALYNLRQLRPAIRAFLRALDGHPASREQSLCLLVTALALDGRTADALRHLAAYEATFGAHPHGWNRELLEQLHRERRDRRH